MASTPARNPGALSGVPESARARHKIATRSIHIVAGRPIGTPAARRRMRMTELSNARRASPLALAPARLRDRRDHLWPLGSPDARVSDPPGGRVGTEWPGLNRLARRF